MRPRSRAGLWVTAWLALGGCQAAPSGWDIALRTDDGALLSVWGPAPAELRAVGGQPGAGLVLERQRNGWFEQPVPPQVPMLHWIHGHDGRWWAVGEAGTVLHDDGSGWTVQPTPTERALWGVFVLEPNDVWAVGGDPFGIESETPVILHFDGAVWTELPIPALDRPAPALFKVWASGPDDVLAVGSAGILLRYDGNAWRQHPSNTANDLISLWGTGPDQVLAVGGRANGTLLRWDGEAAEATVVPQLPGLNGVWMARDGDAWVVGNDGAAGVTAAGTMAVQPQETGANPDVLHAVFGLDGQRFAVGGTLDRTPPYAGVIAVYTP